MPATDKRRRRLKRRRRRSHSSPVGPAEIVRRLTPTFISNIRRGVIMDDAQLQRVARRKGIPPLSKNEIENFRQHWPHLQRFREEDRRRPLEYQTLVKARLGTAFADVAFLGDKRKNDNHVGFLLCVEALTGMMGAVPVKRKTLGAFEEAFETLFRLTQLDYLHLVLCDRETR